MSTPEADRPRPQYGEYATAEEQRARIAQPDPVMQPEPIVEQAPIEQAVEVPAETKPVALTRGRAMDRIITFALLIYGVINVVGSIPALVDVAGYAKTIFTVLGMDVTLSDPSGAKPWGVASAIVLALGWLATALVTWANLRARRISWWIPLVGAIVFTTASAALILVPIMGDPAVMAAFTSSSLG